MTLFLILSLTSLLNAAGPPSGTYEDLGFDTVKVLEYKKTLREQGEKFPRFPPRTGNALIVNMDQYRSKIDSVFTVVEDTRASRAELKDQDLIVVINGKLLGSPDEGDKLLEQITYKDALELRVVRLTENKWERVNITLAPLSEQDYYRSKIDHEHFHDDDFTGSEFWFHRKSQPRFSQGNFQLYVKQRQNAPPPHLYLEMSLFLPDAPHQKDTTKINGFIIKTDRAEYRVAIEDQVESRKLEAEQRSQVMRKKINRFYDSLSVDDRKMLDQLLGCLERLEAAPENTLNYLERHRLARSQVALSRMLQGWELYDLPLKKSQRKMIEEIISSNKVTFWFETVPEKTFEVTPAQKEQLKEILKVFDIAEGKLGE